MNATRACLGCFLFCFVFLLFVVVVFGFGVFLAVISHGPEFALVKSPPLF